MLCCKEVRTVSVCQATAVTALLSAGSFAGTATGCSSSSWQLQVDWSTFSHTPRQSPMFLPCCSHVPPLAPSLTPCAPNSASGCCCCQHCCQKCPVPTLVSPAAAGAAAPAAVRANRCCAWLTAAADPVHTRRSVNSNMTGGCAKQSPDSDHHPHACTAALRPSLE